MAIRVDTKNQTVNNKVARVFGTDELSLSAKGLYMSILLGYEDVALEEKDYQEALNELWSKGYLEYTLK